MEGAYLLWCFEESDSSLEPEAHNFVSFTSEEAATDDYHDKPEQQGHDKPKD